MKCIIHLTTQWPTVYQTFVVSDIETSKEVFDRVLVFGPLLKSKNYDSSFRKSSLLKGISAIVCRFSASWQEQKDFILNSLRRRGIWKTLYILISAFRVMFKSKLHSQPHNVTVHSHFFHHSTEIAMLIKLIFPEVKLVVTGHGSDVFFNSPEYIERAIKFADYIVCASEAVKAAIVRKMSSGKSYDEKLVVRYCRVEMPSVPYTERKSYKKKPIQLITIGRMTPQKGWELACETAKLLKSSGLQFKWEFIGDGELLKNILDSIQSLNLINEIEFRGSLPHSKVLQEISMADIMICPAVVYKSESDGLPVVILEAMSYSKLVISNPVGGIAEALGDNRGILVPPSPDSFKSAIQSVINGDIEDSYLTSNAKRWIQLNCLKGSSDPLVKIYRSLI